MQALWSGYRKSSARIQPVRQDAVASRRRAPPDDTGTRRAVFRKRRELLSSAETADSPAGTAESCRGCRFGVPDSRDNCSQQYAV